MDFKYKWKNGRVPSRDEAATQDSLLDESQFETKRDQEVAEETARRQLNIPLTTGDEHKSILPKADSSQQADMSKP